MNLNPLQNISPIDGRYADKIRELEPFFSEWAFHRYRLRVEVEYFIHLTHFLSINLSDKKNFFIEHLRALYRNFSLQQAQKIKELEKVTNHDVKALEYFLRDELEKKGAGQYREWIHFGLTSQDINHVAVPLMLKEAVREVLLPFLQNLTDTLHKQAIGWKQIPMLARTHGQPASPTSLGKEWMVFVERLEKQTEILSSIPYSAKFGGATGNFNAHIAAFPHRNWEEFANSFVSSFGLQRSRFTTQIDHYDMLAAHLDAWKRICIVLLDFCRDVWLYISMDYFRQKIHSAEVGSSAMPHKINPIDFENAEGNLGIAIALFEHLSSKLPVSRLQRDLSDSTVLRNLGVPFAHMLISMKNIHKGLNKLIVNHEKIQKELNENWAVVAEAIQTILRRENFPDPYNALKNLTRTGEKITAQTLHAFIDSLNISENVKKELKSITPLNYTGNSMLF